MNEILFQAVEKSINELSEHFAKQPYFHRCEHSLHCELFALLKMQRAISDIEIKLKDGNTEHSSQAIHKEWPESRSKEESRRRGNYDLAIIKNADFYSLDNFLHGRIKPVVAIEIGLDYGNAHLERDQIKLQKSNAERCYIIHFARGKGRQKKVEDTVKSIASAENRSGRLLKIVFVNTKIRKWRLLNMREIQTIA
ncbi:MAG: hypothetical protein ACLP2Y_05160 [Limisphaerales bacterium]